MTIFQQKGGKVVATADSLAKPKDCLVVDAKVKHIWNLSGFAWRTHSEMWEEFETNWRAPLSQTLAELHLNISAARDLEEGVVVFLV
jgi:hypothetical protein